jgi:NADH-quinone oxidoreductase subunit L
MALISAFAAYTLYTKKNETVEAITQKIRPLYDLVYKKYLVDELYFGAIINPLVRASENIWAYIDVRFIDRCTYWASDLIRGGGAFVRSLQNGNLQQYAMYIGLGLVLTLTFVMMR